MKRGLRLSFPYLPFPFPTGKFLIQKVVPQASGESSKVKVKVRVNIHGIFSVSSASLVEVQKSDETEEPMETDQAADKDGEVPRPNKCPSQIVFPFKEALSTSEHDLFVSCL